MAALSPKLGHPVAVDIMASLGGDFTLSLFSTSPFNNPEIFMNTSVCQKWCVLWRDILVRDP